MKEVRVFVFDGNKWIEVACLSDVMRGIPELVEALDTLTHWLSWSWRVEIYFKSRRQE